MTHIEWYRHHERLTYAKEVVIKSAKVKNRGVGYADCTGDVGQCQQLSGADTGYAAVTFV
jgi:hypothetical protein